MDFKALVEGILDDPLAGRGDPDLRDNTGYSGPARRIAKVVLFNKDGNYDSEVTLDSEHYDNIGWTKESLAKYVNEILIPPGSGKRWYVASDKVRPLRGRRR